MNSANTGIRHRIRAYFSANPTEELTKSDIAIKFDCSEKTVEQALWMLKAEGAIVRAIVYRASPVTP
jgi:DNA-binding GntR family transcriptional regulator